MTTTIDDLKKAIEETESDRNEVFLQSQTLREETFQTWLDNQELEISDEELDRIAEQLSGKIEDVEIMRESLTQLQNDFADHLENHPSGSGGSGGGGGTCNLSSTFSGGSFSDSTVIEIPYNFYSSNLGTSMLYVEIKASNGELDTMTLPILENGEGVCRLGVLAKNTYTVKLYALDSRGVESNPLTFKIDIGSLEVTSTFNDNINYQISDAINIPLVVSSARNAEITAYIVIDGKEYTQTVIKGYNMFQLTTAMKTVGVHKVVIYLSNGVETSNTLTYNIVIINPYTLLISTKQEEITIDYGYVINLEYKISATTNMDVFVTYYIDNNVVGSYTVSTGDNIWRITDRLDSGQHTLKVVASSGVGQAELVVPLTVKESTFKPIEHVEAGLIAYFNANDKSNVDENKQVWVSRVPNDNGDYINATLYNYNYSSNGWENGWLHSTVGSYVEIDFQPLLNNVLSGFTFDILFRSRHMGQDDNIVASCRDLVGTQKGFIITSDEARIKGDTNNIYNKYMDNEETRVTFVIDRTSTYVDADGKTQENPMVQIYLNGVLSSASLLTDSGSGSNRVYESFVTNSKIYLNGLSGGDSAGESFIKTVRVYNRPLGHEEVLQNVLADIEDISVQREQYELNYELLEQLIPTMYFYDSEIGTHANMTKDNKQYIRIRYDSPDENKFGKSFDYPVCQTAWQGTSSLQYPIKNYKFKLYDYAYDETTGEPISTTDKDTFVKKKINPYTDGTGYEESTFCLKADYMESSHGRNTGTAKFVNNVLFAGANNPAKQQDSKVRETINGFPIVLYINGQRMGVYNFNHDKSCSKSLGFETIPNMFRFEISANSETTTGAFNKTWSSSVTKENIYEELLSDYEIAYNEDRFEANDGEFDVTSYYDALGLAHDGTVMGGYKDRALLALAEFVQFVSESSDEEYKENLHKYCDIKHAIRYWIAVQMLGMIDNYAKNTMINCYDGHIFYFTFYDMDSSIGLDNTGYQINPSDIEMMDKDSTNTYYFNCATSKMWSKLFRCFYDEICEEYINLRNGAFTQETIKKYIVEEQIDQIPIILYNQDQFSKYISQGRQYLHMLHGRNKEHIIRWIDERIKFLDSLFMGIQSIYTSKSITIRSNSPSSNTTYTATLNITPYYSQYITVKWRNGEFETHKVKKGQTQKYSFNMVNATDNEVLVYSADNLKTIGTLQNMNPSSLDIGNATGLIELSCKSSPALLKVDVSKNVKLQKIDLKGCTLLGDESGGSGANILDVRNCINLTYVDIRSSKIDNVLNNPNGCAIETLYLSDNTNVVRLVGYSRLKNFSCGSGLTSFYAKDVTSFNVWTYAHYDSLEELYIDNCNIGTTYPLLNGSKILKTVTLKNLNDITSFEWRYNRPDAGHEEGYDAQGFTLQYFELSNCPKLVNIYLGNRTHNNAKGAFGFDADTDSIILFTNLPSINLIHTGGISGLKRMIIPKNLPTFNMTITTQSWAGGTYSDEYFYINGGGYYNDKTKKCFTWDTIISEERYNADPSTRGIVSLLDMPNCSFIFNKTNAIRAFKLFEGVVFFNLQCSSSSSQFVMPYEGTQYVNCTFKLSNYSASYPSSSYVRYLENIDFRTCILDTIGYIKPNTPQHLGFKNCTFASFEQYMEILNKVYITGSYVGDSSVLNRQPNTIESEEDVEITIFSYTATSTRTDYPFNGWTINGNIKFNASYKDIGYLLYGAVINGNVDIHDNITNATYLLNKASVNGNINIGANSANMNYLLNNATVNGKVNIDVNCKGTFDYFMKGTKCEEAPLLPIGASSINYEFQNSTITKTPNNWDRNYTTVLNDGSIKFNAYSGCNNISQIAPVTDNVVGEYVDGSLDDIYTHWGGNKLLPVEPSQFEIVLTDDDVPYVFDLTTSSDFVNFYANEVDWGDGTTNESDAHTYTEAGTYIISTSKLPTNSCFTKVTRIPYLHTNYKYIKTKTSYPQSIFAYANNLTYINFGAPRVAPSHLFSRTSYSDGYDSKVNVTIDLDCKNINTLEHLVSNGGGFGGYTLTTGTITINLKNVNNIKSMYGMLQYNKSQQININIVDETSLNNLENVCRMFDSCKNLISCTLPIMNMNKVKDMSYMFYGCNALSTLNSNIADWDVSNVEAVASMFYYCEYLTELNLSKWKITNKVTNMKAMFYCCKKLQSLDLSNWDVSNVTDMSNMFQDCNNLKTLNLSTWNTTKVTSCGSMLYEVPANVDFCYNKENYSDWTLTESNTAYTGFFPWTPDEELGLIFVEYTIYPCSDTDTMDMETPGSSRRYYHRYLPHFFKLSGSNEYSRPLFGLGHRIILTLHSGEETNDLSTLAKDVAKVRIGWKPTDDYYLTFAGYDSNANGNDKNHTMVEEILYMDMSGQKSLYNLFQSCAHLKKVSNLVNLDKVPAGKITYILQDCTRLEKIDLSDLNVSSITKVSTMSMRRVPITVDWCYDGTNYTDWNFAENDLGFDGMFPWNATYIEYTINPYSSTDIVSAKTYNDFTDRYFPRFYYTNTNDTNIYYGSTTTRVIREITLKNGEVTSDPSCLAKDVEKIKITYSKHYNPKFICMTTQDSAYSRVKEILYLDLSNLTTMSDMFNGCRFLENVDGFVGNVEQITSLYQTFYGCASLTELDLSDWDVSKVTDFSHAFNGCTNLITLNISGWDVSNAKSLSGMFKYCNSLTELDLSSWIVNTLSINGILYNTPTLTLYYDSTKLTSAFQSIMDTYPDKTWIDVSTQNLAQQVNTLQEESDIMMLALTELYEANATNGATTNTSTATTFGLRARATVSYIDLLMPTIYAKLIRRGYKTIDDVPATLRTSVQEILNQTE